MPASEARAARQRGWPGACRLSLFRERTRPAREGASCSEVDLRVFASAVLAAAVAGAGPAAAQKSGGTLRIYHRDSPASMSIHEEATDLGRRADDGRCSTTSSCSTSTRRRTASTIDRARSRESWSWSEDGKELTFKLRQGVKWHDGKPFTAADVKCTWDLLHGKAKEQAAPQPAQGVVQQSRRGHAPTATTRRSFHLKRPQPALLALLASGYSPVYPCHVPPAQMRQHPIGTGPFKFVEFKPNEYIKVAQEPGLLEDRAGPISTAIEYTIIAEPLDGDPRPLSPASST